MDLLERLTDDLDKQKILPNNEELSEFFFSYLTDAVNIIIFFENYMKAELLLNGICVHRIKKEIPAFKELGKKQFREPILLKDIHAIEPFEINEEKEEIFHRAIKETTIGMKDLIGTEEYIKHYQFNRDVLEFIKELTFIRKKPAIDKIRNLYN